MGFRCSTGKMNSENRPYMLASKPCFSEWNEAGEKLRRMICSAGLSHGKIPMSMQEYSGFPAAEKCSVWSADLTGTAKVQV